MDKVRTPDERFENLPDWPYAPRYVEISDGLRVHYVDEGPPDGRLVLLAHGEPSWSYLYRKMIPLLVDAGCRTVAFDLVGFGRSDKPTAQDDYSYEGHVGWFDEAVRGIGLRDITLFGQDWGGITGLAHVVLHPGLDRGVVCSNSGLFPGMDDERYRAGARIFPQLLPSTADHPSSPFCQSLFAGPLQACEVPRANRLRIA
jgi:haloalkane dehalogenase